MTPLSRTRIEKPQLWPSWLHYWMWRITWPTIPPKSQPSAPRSTDNSERGEWGVRRTWARLHQLKFYQSKIIIKWKALDDSIAPQATFFTVRVFIKSPTCDRRSRWSSLSSIFEASLLFIFNGELWNNAWLGDKGFSGGDLLIFHLHLIMDVSKTVDVIWRVLRESGGVELM